MKPWELVNTDRETAPVINSLSSDTMRLWEREKPESVSAPVKTPVKNPPRHDNSLTPEELKQYLEFSRRNIQARIDAENFDMEMMQALRLDFAERRLNKHGHG